MAVGYDVQLKIFALSLLILRRRGSGVAIIGSWVSIYGIYHPLGSKPENAFAFAAALILRNIAFALFTNPVRRKTVLGLWPSLYDIRAEGGDKKIPTICGRKV